jgi:hypothetical protein
MSAACFRKLVEGGVAYAHELGFSPHGDYAVASQIFGDVESTACPARFEYGHEGKPFYVSGPHENFRQLQAIMEQLERQFPWLHARLRTQSKGKVHSACANDEQAVPTGPDGDC